MLSIKLFPGRCAAIGDTLIALHPKRGRKAAHVVIEADRFLYVHRDILGPGSTASEALRQRALALGFKPLPKPGDMHDE